MKFHLSLDTFVISDSHFGHKAILKKEPSRSVLAKQMGFEDFNTLSVHLWNTQVKEGDFILHLGDLYFKNGWQYLSGLAGQKRLLVGNNDLKKYTRLKDYPDWKICRKIQLKIAGKNKIYHKLESKYGKGIWKNKLLNTIVADLGSERVMFSHFPVIDRKKNDNYASTRDILDDIFRLCDCSINIHGHTHSRNTKDPFCLNVSGENIGFSPMRIQDVLALRP
ncbi:hypothetical protein BKH46_05640 [Helicobacter sp. 12S02634-8]|uniref:metallophosphoesterase n=1 Tax=Helicobacter sp. 12S02634-8 TaxID=1476199 RepID=UPI000BA7DCA3|nr:metallophosphoesterase [Helicobacter sp. 12S02634-8]PAF46926.1 hypothetical protein BKH46_05640 [Helicobacter sp. 12S02634-8]